MSVLKITEHWQIPLSEFEFTYSRSSGPGGQNVNKVSSRATLRWAAVHSPSWLPGALTRFQTRFGSRLTTEGELLISSQESRDQERNRQLCLEKLQELLAAIAVAPKKRRPTKRSRGSQERRLEAKRGRSEVKSLRQRPHRPD
ncbi:MAG: alternative ribosome rescue aminoacyl-tRNA hydrolase ArfB [Planctomycetota bacterium]